MKRNIGKYILIGLSILIIGFLIWYFRAIVSYILIAGVIALIGNPIVSLICKIRIKKFSPPRALGAAITLILLLAFFTTFFMILIPLVVGEINNLAKIDVKTLVARIEQPLLSFQGFMHQNNIDIANNLSITEYLSNGIKQLFDVSEVSTIIGSFAGAFGEVFIAIFSISFISFFFMKEQRLFGNVILAIIPEKYFDETNNALDSISKLLKRYFVGIIIEMISIWVLTTIGLSIVGLEFNYVLIVASFAAMITVIPYLGPIIGSLFGLFVAFATHLHLDFFSGLLPLLGLMSLVYIFVHVIDNILFQPLIYSSSVHAHPLEIFLVIMIGGHLAGIVGMVLAIPTFTILRVVAKEFFYNIEIVNKFTKGI